MGDIAAVEVLYSVQWMHSSTVSVCVFVLHQVPGMHPDKQAIFHAYGPLCR